MFCRPFFPLFAKLSLILLMLTLSGCLTVGPDYVPPDTQAPGAWHARLTDGLTTGTLTSQALASWWSGLNDPLLTELIEQATASNLDLKSAVSRLRQARRQRAVTRADLLPTLSTQAGVTRTHTDTQTKQSAGGAMGTAAGDGTGETTGNGGQTTGDGGSDSETDLYSAQFDASWEIDVFGGNRRNANAAQHDVEASEAELYGVLISLAAEVATNYVDARSYQQRIGLAEANLRLQRETLQLVEFKFQAELINELAVQQARYNYQSTAAEIPSLRISLSETLNQLAVLLGSTPGTVHARMQEHRPLPDVPSEIAVGAPSEALRRRPDIRQAERTLAAKTELVGAAVAELYPKFYLSGSLSRQGNGTSGFFNYATNAWSLGPSISWDIFKGGAVKANIDVQTEVRQQALLTYQSTVLTALQEVENKLYALGQQQVRTEKLALAAQAAQNACELAQTQYKVGQIDFSDVLSAEQALVSYQDQLAQSQGTHLTDLIALYKALGGGWDPSAPADTTQISLSQREEPKP